MSDTKQYPDFSVLMSLYAKEKAEYFDECMHSIIHQTVQPSEIVIVLEGRDVACSVSINDDDEE